MPPVVGVSGHPKLGHLATPKIPIFAALYFGTVKEGLRVLVRPPLKLRLSSQNSVPTSTRK